MSEDIFASFEVEDEESRTSGEEDNFKKEMHHIDGYAGVANILQKCNLQSLLQNFVEEEVDDDFIINLDVENSIEWTSVSTLLPTIGSRGKFRLQVKEYQEKY